MTVFFFWAAVGSLLFLGVGAVAAALMGETPFQTARASMLTVLSDDYAVIERGCSAKKTAKPPKTTLGGRHCSEKPLNISRQR